MKDPQAVFLKSKMGSNGTAIGTADSEKSRQSEQTLGSVGISLIPFKFDILAMILQSCH